MLLDDFKKTVDSYAATISSQNLLEACELLEIDTTSSYSGRQVTTKLYDNIKQALNFNDSATVEKISITQLLKLQSELVYRYVLYNEEPAEYLKIVNVIRDSSAREVTFIPPFSEISKWEEIIINCKNYNEFSPSTHSIRFGNLRKDYPKDFDIAVSVKKLIGKGCQIEIKDSDIQIISGLEAVVDELNEKVKLLGGITLAASLFNHLNKHGKYSKRLERYLITREASGISFDQKPQIPYGFLLNLSLKYPFENLKLKNSSVLLNEIIDLAISITNGAYGVQHYNYWEYHFQSGETIIQFCTEIALWDSMFTIPQCRPSAALEITDKLFSFIEEDNFQSALGFTKYQFLLVANEIHSIASDPNIPTPIYHSALCKKLKQIDRNIIQSILDFLSHSGSINDKYILPSDYSSIDFFLKPLIKVSSTKFILINVSWCSPNYFEALATFFREDFKKQKRDLDTDIGKQLEMYLQNKLTEKGISFLSGEYKVDGNDGECDLIIESENAIVLIEFKKKAFTRKAKSGNDIQILLDLSDSILAAQLQAGRTEIILREKGTITLKGKDGKTNVINLNDRQIERVALTQLEFGGFQDRSIVNQLLKSLATHSFGTHSADPIIFKKFEKLAVKQKLWSAQWNKLYELDKEFSRFPYFNCWFLSLPQLLEVINMSNDNNSFYDIFSKTKYVSMNTLDWYREFDIATKLLYEQKL